MYNETGSSCACFLFISLQLRTLQPQIQTYANMSILLSSTERGDFLLKEIPFFSVFLWFFQDSSLFRWFSGLTVSVGNHRSLPYCSRVSE